MMNTLLIPFLVVIGAVSLLLLDTYWFSEQRKGIKIIEHYHLGLGLFIGAALSVLYGNQLWSLSVGFTMIGAGMMMFLAEWRQTPEISGRHIAMGHPFSWKSDHFKSSSVVGIGLTIIAIYLLIIIG